ncbi:hypothetical protein DACRYDRAFT_71502, partial [Dacryopinax primogenitus]
MARRSLGAHLSIPNQRITAVADVTGPETEGIVYSGNWAGPVYSGNGGTYTAVTGTFTVPTPSEPVGGLGHYGASAWVGIDGYSCGIILHTGVDFMVHNGIVSYGAWYEWYPDAWHDFPNISFSAGDEVRVTVTATNTTSGTAVIENLTTGETVTQDITSSSALCQKNAEWIVEDYSVGGSFIQFANFSSVTFTNAVATTSSGSTQDPSGATHILDIEQNNEVLTSVTTGTSTTTI